MPTEHPPRWAIVLGGPPRSDAPRAAVQLGRATAKIASHATSSEPSPYPELHETRQISAPAPPLPFFPHARARSPPALAAASRAARRSWRPRVPEAPRATRASRRPPPTCRSPFARRSFVVCPLFFRVCVGGCPLLLCARGCCGSGATLGAVSAARGYPPGIAAAWARSACRFVAGARHWGG